MLGHMIAQIKPRTAPHDERAEAAAIAYSQEEVLSTIRELHALSRRGLWGILLFLAVSALTLYSSEAGLFASVPSDVKELFGDPPPVQLLHIALGVSWLSAFILILGRRSGEGKPCYSWYNIGLPTAFYPLSIFSDRTGTFFPAVFAAGLLLLVVEHATVVSYATRVIEEETARLRRLDNK